MYPVIRFALEMLRARRMPPLAMGETHVTSIRCWPWDIDAQMEMNNGRALTLFDIGRVSMFLRMGVLGEMSRRKWFGTIAGSTVRYRRRITLFQRLELRSRVIGADARFTYIEQGFWRGDDCCAHAVLRAAITTGQGIIPSQEVPDAFGYCMDDMELPDWVLSWDAAEAKRPWPPMQS